MLTGARARASSTTWAVLDLDHHQQADYRGEISMPASITRRSSGSRAFPIPSRGYPDQGGCISLVLVFQERHPSLWAIDSASIEVILASSARRPDRP